MSISAVGSVSHAFQTQHAAAVYDPDKDGDADTPGAVDSDGSAQKAAQSQYQVDIKA